MMNNKCQICVWCVLVALVLRVVVAFCRFQAFELFALGALAIFLRPILPAGLAALFRSRQWCPCRSRPPPWPSSGTQMHRVLWKMSIALMIFLWSPPISPAQILRCVDSSGGASCRIRIDVLTPAWSGLPSAASINQPNRAQLQRGCPDLALVVCGLEQLAPSPESAKVMWVKALQFHSGHCFSLWPSRASPSAGGREPTMASPSFSLLSKPNQLR